MPQSEPTFLPTVFISYASEDRPKAEDLYGRLNAAGYRPWMDCKDILSGEDWERSLSRAISKADFFVACLTRNSVAKRGFLQKEILQALDKWREKLPEDIYLIPVKFEECEIPNRLSRFQTIDLFGDENGHTKLFEALNTGVRRLAGEHSPTQTHQEHYRVAPTQFAEEDASGRMSLSFPQILPADAPWVEDVNLRLGGWIAEQRQDFRVNRLWSNEERRDRKILPDRTFPRSELQVAYSVRLFTRELFSVEFTGWFYGSGAAHGNTTFQTFNWLLDPPATLHLGTLFKHRSPYLDVVAELCRDDLLHQSAGQFDQDVKRGTSSEFANFRSFSLTETSLRILFPPYQVGPFGWGPREVTIPYSKLGPFLRKDGPLRSLLS